MKFTALPLELLLHILCFLPDLTCLRTATKSCGTLRRAFRDYESSVLHHVLRNYLGSESFDDALATLRSKHKGAYLWDETEATRFLGQVSDMA